MGFGKKKIETFEQNDGYDLASKAMRARRLAVVRIPFRLHLDNCLMNHFSNKAVIQMLEKMVGVSKPKEQKDLMKAFEDSQYKNTDGDLVVPCRILKAACVEGAIETAGAVSKAELKRGLRVLGYTAPIKLPKDQKVTMDVRLVRNMTGVPDIRARALIPQGSTVDFAVQFPTTLSPDKVIASLEAAGQSIGIFDFRPQKGGDLGTFNVELLPKEAVDDIIARCAVPEQPYEIPQVLLRAYNASLESDSDAERHVGALVEHVNGQSNGKGKKKASQPEA
jgi:hypothetical protein